MIFISHTHKDKPIVEPIANKLKEVFGQEEIFYDSWSMQPGDGIISKMNEGLSNVDYFLFFASKNSLKSGLVSMEWQNILMKTANNPNIKFIPIKLDDCIMPDILLQTLYIDIYGKGFEFGVLQLINVLQGNSTYDDTLQEFENLRAEVTPVNNQEFIINISAIAYSEPISRFVLVMDNEFDEINGEPIHDNILNTDFYPNVIESYNGFYFGVERATTPSLPFSLKIKSTSPIKLFKVAHKNNTETAKFIPCTFKI